MASDEPFEIDSLDKLVEFERAARTNFGTRNIWFRGLKRAEYELVPDVFRHNRVVDGRCAFEASITSAFMARARSRYTKSDLPIRTFDWLTFMRHYELPTRLLDWTESCGVASFFATQPPRYSEAEKAEGIAAAGVPAVIWAVNPLQLWKMRATWPERIPDSEDAESGGGVLAALRDITRHCKTGQLLCQSTHSAKDRFPIPVLPDETNRRMLVQRATFTIHPGPEPLESFFTGATPLLKGVVPAGVRAKLHAGLIALGIDEAGLFPDVDNLAKGLAERYAIPETEDRT